MLNMIIFGYFSIFLLVILTIKNKFVLSAHVRAIEITHHKNNIKVRNELRKYYVNTYTRHVFHPFKWTFKQMFPEFEKYE